MIKSVWKIKHLKKDNTYELQNVFERKCLEITDIIATGFGMLKLKQGDKIQHSNNYNIKIGYYQLEK
ncbi:MAG: hypothetical protein ACQBVK_04750 [Candidatus Phytoplasma sp. TWB_XP]